MNMGAAGWSGPLRNFPSAPPLRWSGRKLLIIPRLFCIRASPTFVWLLLLKFNLGSGIGLIIGHRRFFCAPIHRKGSGSIDQSTRLR